MRARHTPLACALAAALLLPALGQAQQQRFATLDDALRASGILAGRQGPQTVNWIEGGRRFSFTARDPRTGQEEIRAMDPATGRDTLLFGGQGLVFPDTKEPFEYDSFQWARDSKHLVFQTRFKPIYRKSGTSDWFIYSLTDRTLSPAARGARTAELSPDGRMLGLERGGEMYVVDLATHAERKLTSDATEHVFNGHFDWVYEEEFGMAQAWRWSNDSRWIAYWQIDERAEPVVQLTDYSGHHPEWDRIRIPQPGDSNPTARIGVVNVKTGAKRWLDTGERGELYIPRIYWTSRADTLAVITLNRSQNAMKLFFFDVTTGGRRQVMSETSKTWIDVYDFYAGIQDMMTFPEGSAEFFWISDRDGWQHIYRYDYSGKVLQQVTSGRWSATRVEGIDPKRRLVYYSSTEVSPLQRQLYQIGFDGTGKKRLTTTEGTHSIDMSPDARWYLDRWSNTRQPLQVELWSTAGEKVRTLEDNTQTAQWVATHAYSPESTFTVTASDGAKIDASIIKPVPFDPARKYPVVFAIYGGPGSQAVYDKFNTSTWEQWLAQQGYIVVDVNNRGTNNYGSEFMKTVYKQLGKWESHDFAEVARHLGTLPWVDARRTAIVGTSYGGYAALYTMEQYPDLFPVGIANSAVTDWRLYDTIYTERYMGTLPDNPKGYDSSSVLLNVPKLGGKLLLIHAMMDDNVHPQQTMQLLTALTEAGKDAELRIYPPGRHGSAYDLASYRLIQQNMDRFLAEHLKGRAPAQ